MRGLCPDRDLRPRGACSGTGARGAGHRRGAGVDHGPAARSQGGRGRLREPHSLMTPSPGFAGYSPRVAGEGPDPITLGVVWGALQSICIEIGSTVQRTAYSIQAREGQDFSVAVFDARGRMSAQGPYSPGHMGAMNFAVRNFLTAFPVTSIRPGDTLLLNDPQLGSGHFPDFLDAALLLAGRTCGLRCQPGPPHRRGGLAPREPGRRRHLRLA